MGLRGKLTERVDQAAKKAAATASRAADEVGKVASSVADAGEEKQGGKISGAFAGLRGLARPGEEEPISAEAYLKRLVAAVRRDDDEEDRTGRDVYLSAKRRRRKLGLLSLGTGPFAGVTSQVVDLYCDVAVLVDLSDLHQPGLSNSEIAAHAVLMWGFADSYERAAGAIASDPPLAELISKRLGNVAGERMPDKTSPRSIASAIWRARTDVAAVKKASVVGAVKGAAFTGRSTKKAIATIERQLRAVGRPQLRTGAGAQM